jgi:serine/threonine protein kinase
MPGTLLRRSRRVIGMTDLFHSIIKHCPGVPPALLEQHVRRMPESYAERYSPTEIARHLKLLTRLGDEHPVEVEVRPLGGPYYEVCVVGFDRTGVLAAITTALASDDFDVQDLQLSTYMPEHAHEHKEDGRGEPAAAHFVDVVRVASNRRGRPVAEIAGDLRDRLTLAFKHLAEGNLQGAQSAASDSRSNHGTRRPGPKPFQSSLGPVKEGLELGDFRLERKLATGGMGDVYLATQISLEREVAVKLVSSLPDASPELLTRFEKEALVLASFTSPYIVPVLASGIVATGPDTVLRWFAMEYLPGGDLALWIKQKGPPPIPLGTRWLEQALQGLLYAHDHSVVHRDLKPHNLLLTAGRDVKISDFGLVKDARRPDLTLTLQGAVLGTPQYISPEQAGAEEADERADIYSLGASFFHLFSGRLAFEEQSATTLLLKITQNDPPRLLDVAPQVPRPLAVILDRMMARRPEDRYQDVDVILADLRSYLRRGLLKISEGERPAEGPAPEDPAPDLTRAYVPQSKPSATTPDPAR